MRWFLPVSLAVSVAFLGGCVNRPGFDFSPDASRLVVPTGDASHLMVVAPGQKPDRLPGTEGGLWPSWSPDGRYLLFGTNDGLKLYDLEQRRVTRPLQEAMAPASWSPDGKSFVAFVKREDPEPGGPEPKDQKSPALLWYKLEGGPPRRMPAPFQQASPDQPPMWLPDGSAVAVLAIGSGQNLFFADPQGFRQMTFTGDVIGAGVTADGQRLVWARSAPQEPSGVTLYSKSIRTLAVSRVAFGARLPGRSRNLGISVAAFSPGATRLALVGEERRRTDVYTAGAGDAEARLMESFPVRKARKGEDLSAARALVTARWSADGRNIALLVLQQNRLRLRTYSRDGTGGATLPLPVK
jgi:dipeptidyl aminopeptidase/acylaminoacyl peptidase